MDHKIFHNSLFVDFLCEVNCMINNHSYIISLIVAGVILISELPGFIAGYLLSDLILALYVSYLIKTFFMRAVFTKEFEDIQEFRH